MASNNYFCYSLNEPIRPPPPTQSWNPNLSRFYQPSYLQSIDIQQRQQQPQQHAAVMNYSNEQSPNIQVNEVAENFPDKNPENGQDKNPESGEDKNPESGEDKNPESGEDEPNSDIWVYRRPTSLKYYMPDRDNRGIGVIVTNEKFRGGKDRSGVNKDRENIRKMFITMRLRIFEFNELTSLEMKNELMKVSKYEVNNSDFVLVVAFSTHGDEKDALYGSDGISISLRADIISLFKPLNCKSLEGKPKIFLIQACRGTSEDYIIRNGVYRDALEKEEIVSNESDILIAYACAPNYRAYRTKREGSWFINDLCTNFMHFQDDYDLVKILTITNQSLMLRVDTSDNTDKIAQSSNIHSTLRKDIFLKSHNTVQEPVAVDDHILVTSKPNISPQTEETTQSASEVEPIVSDVQTEISNPNSKFEFLPKYELTGEYSGLGIILVNHSCGRLIRRGSRKDLENFTHIFQNMKLKIVIKEDFDYTVVKFIKEEIKTHEKLKSYFLAISTHGTEDSISFHNGTKFEISVLVNELQKPIHAGKPKVILIQACRGDSESADMSSIVIDALPTVSTLESDMLKAYSCVKGNTSFREGDVGSWFVASLRACVDGMKRPCNILQLLTATNNYMLTHFEVKNKRGVKMRQACEVSHTLCAELII